MAEVGAAENFSEAEAQAQLTAQQGQAEKPITAIQTEQQADAAATMGQLTQIQDASLVLAQHMAAGSALSGADVTRQVADATSQSSALAMTASKMSRDSAAQGLAMTQLALKQNTDAAKAAVGATHAQTQQQLDRQRAEAQGVENERVARQKMLEEQQRQIQAQIANDNQMAAFARGMGSGGGGGGGYGGGGGGGGGQAPPGPPGADTRYENILGAGSNGAAAARALANGMSLEQAKKLFKTPGGRDLEWDTITRLVFNNTVGY